MVAKKSGRQSAAQACPCGGSVYAQCCGRFVEQGVLPLTALELMRSRYSAYVLRNEDYLRATWYGSTCPNSHLLDDAGGIKWLSLDIVRHHQQDGDATVEFIARYKVQGRAQALHEISRFVRENDRWFYLDGQFPDGK